MELLYGLVEVLLRPPVRRGLRWRIEGVERIPAEGPVLLASNHLSYFDPIAVANLTDLAGRRVRFLAKAELFEHRVIPPPGVRGGPDGKRRKAERFRTPITMVVGEPIPVGPTANPRETTDRIMTGICAAVARARRIYPPAAGEGQAWWARPPESARLRSCRGRVAQALLDAEGEGHA